MSTTGTSSSRPSWQTGEQELGLNARFTSIVFAALLLLFCGWALSLPLFPTQDGPMHKYYVHVMASLLSGSHDYNAYVIRHPFPPYATHYLVLLGLTRFLSFDLAEKIFICLILIATAYSFRYCARSLGPAGAVLSVCAVPLMLHWSLVMGFLNFSLAVGLFFLATGIWYRAAAGDRRLWLLFAVVVAGLTFTHPVPLLLLIAFCALDLLIRLVQDRARARNPAETQSGAPFSLRDYGWQLFGLVFAGLCFLYPLASVDRQRSASNLHGIGLHKDVVISAVALFGISPFDTRSRNLLINLYRLGLYALLFGSLALAATGLAGRWRAKRLRSGDTMLFGAVALMLAIPILPLSMNGSDYFSQRLTIFPWLGAICAASACPISRRLARIALWFSVILTVITLLAAEIFIRPVSRQLVALEQQPLPLHAQGLALLDPAMLKLVRVQHQLGFNPYLWSGALPFLHADGVLLNSPFMDQKITPLRPVPGGDLLIDQMSSAEEAERVINGNVNLPALPPQARSLLLANTRVIMFVAAPADVDQGLAPLVGSSTASRYKCQSHTWYLVCVEA